MPYLNDVNQQILKLFISLLTCLVRSLLCSFVQPILGGFSILQTFYLAVHIFPIGPTNLTWFANLYSIISQVFKRSTERQLPTITHYPLLVCPLAGSAEATTFTTSQLSFPTSCCEAAILLPNIFKIFIIVELHCYQKMFFNIIAILSQGDQQIGNKPSAFSNQHGLGIQKKSFIFNLIAY